MADDLEIDFAKMHLWTEVQARQYFESGEEPVAAAPEEEADATIGPDPELVEMLQSARREKLPSQMRQPIAGGKRFPKAAHPSPFPAASIIWRTFLWALLLTRLCSSSCLTVQSSYQP